MRRIQPGSIVVAADGSADASRAVRWATEQAVREHRRLTVVSVGSARGVARDAVRVAEDIAPGIDADAHPVVGDPRDVLTHLSREAHLLVLGSRGRGPARSTLLGSVSAAVVRSSRAPTVVCRPTDPTEQRRGVLLGVDGGAGTQPAVDFAFAFAAARGLPLTALHCHMDIAAAAAAFRREAGLEEAPPELGRLHLLLAESLAGYAEKYPDVEVVRRLHHGMADEALSDAGGAWDLIVVGRPEMSNLARLVRGSIALGVVERARCTVAVVPETVG